MSRKQSPSFLNHLKWHQDELKITVSDGRLLPINRKQKVFPNGTLIIENVERSSDQATYVCVARNSQGYSARGSLEVQVMGKSLFILHIIVAGICTICDKTYHWII